MGVCKDEDSGFDLGSSLEKPYPDGLLEKLDQKVIIIQFIDTRVLDLTSRTSNEFPDGVSMRTRPCLVLQVSTITKCCMVALQKQFS